MEGYIEYLKSLRPPFRCIYENDEYVATGRDKSYWTLTPCYKTTNNGEPIKVTLDTPLFGVYLLYEQKLEPKPR